jgi:hypothetical protein
MHHHDLSRSTHTLELDQLRELGERLAAPHAPTGLTAADLGVAGEAVSVRQPAWYRHLLHDVDDVARLAPTSVLREIHAEGPPDFPYVWGRFSPVGYEEAPGTHPWLDAPLHGDALHRLSRRFGLRHRWTQVA